MTITPEQLAAWKALADMVRQPWRVYRWDDDRGDLIIERPTDGTVPDLVGDEEAKAFIEGASQALPALIAEVERLQHELTQFNYAKTAAACVSDGRLPFVITADGQILPPEED